MAKLELVSLNEHVITNADTKLKLLTTNIDKLHRNFKVTKCNNKLKLKQGQPSAKPKPNPTMCNSELDDDNNNDCVPECGKESYCISNNSNNHNSNNNNCKRHPSNNRDE